MPPVPIDAPIPQDVWLGADCQFRKVFLLEDGGVWYTLPDKSRHWATFPIWSPWQATATLLVRLGRKVVHSDVPVRGDDDERITGNWWDGTRENHIPSIPSHENLALRISTSGDVVFENGSGDYCDLSNIKTRRQLRQLLLLLGIPDEEFA
jgi:hypothetical protein